MLTVAASQTIEMTAMEIGLANVGTVREVS